MSSSPLRIVVNEVFAGYLARELLIPHSLSTIKDHDDAGIAHLLGEADVFVSNAFKPTWRDRDRCTIRLVHAIAAGTDGIDFAALPSGCTVCNVYGHERGVAEQAYMLMLALNKGLFGLDAALRRGDWTRQRPYLPELRDRELLILGLGHIGRELIRWGQFLGMKITVLTRNPVPGRGADLGIKAIGGLHELRQHLPAADFVVVAIPATLNTLDLIGATELDLMKPTAFVVNVGRGPVINEDALYEALKIRRIAGAGLDVWWQYPALGKGCMPSRRPFHELDNVVMTPHKPTIETMAYRWKEIGLNIQRFARGEQLHRIVSPA